MTAILLDTHIILWFLTDSPRLPRPVRDQLQDTANDVFFSAASIWEIAIKTGRGRPAFRTDPLVIAQAARDSGFAELPVHVPAAARVAHLPLHHRDPFDRLLIAQAITQTLRLYTADPLLPPYSELVTLIA